MYQSSHPQKPSEQTKYAGSHAYKTVSVVGGGNVQAESLGSDEGNAHRLHIVCWCCAVVIAVVVVHLLHAAFCISCKSQISSRQAALSHLASVYPAQEWSETLEDLLQ